MSSEVYEADKRRKKTRKRHHAEIERSVDTEFTGQSQMRASINKILDQIITQIKNYVLNKAFTRHSKSS